MFNNFSAMFRYIIRKRQKSLDYINFVSLNANRLLLYEHNILQGVSQITCMSFSLLILHLEF